jgi:hypothetical protein
MLPYECKARLYGKMASRDTKTFDDLGERMATEKQIAANRANANRSTGPKTKLGRRASSRNALRHGLSCPSPMNESISMDVDNLTQTFVQEGASDDQRAAARQVAQAQMDLSRIRTVRATLMASLDLERCNYSELRRLMVLDRYERLARARRGMAANKL